MTPDSEEAKQFWESIWSIESTHHKDAEWLKKLKEEVELRQQAELSITIDMVTQFLRKVPNWKAPGPDMVQGFWLKNFTSLHHNIANQLQVCLELRLWERSWVDDQGMNCPYNEIPRERYSRKLPPHNLFTCNVEVANRDNIWQALRIPGY